METLNLEQIKASNSCQADSPKLKETIKLVNNAAVKKVETGQLTLASILKEQQD